LSPCLIYEKNDKKEHNFFVNFQHKEIEVTKGGKTMRTKGIIAIFTISCIILSSANVFGHTFPKEPTARLGKGTIESFAYLPDGKLLAGAGSLGV